MSHAILLVPHCFQVGKILQPTICNPILVTTVEKSVIYLVTLCPTLNHHLQDAPFAINGEEHGLWSPGWAL